MFTTSTTWQKTFKNCCLSKKLLDFLFWNWKQCHVLMKTKWKRHMSFSFILRRRYFLLAPNLQLWQWLIIQQECKYEELMFHALRENCRNTEFFWSVFSRIWTEYGDLRSKSPHSVQIRENTDQKKIRIRILFGDNFSHFAYFLIALVDILFHQLFYFPNCYFFFYPWKTFPVSSISGQFDDQKR